MKYSALLLSIVSLFCASALRAGDVLVQSGDRVAFLGDSITAQGASGPGGYVRLVASGLETQGIKITVIPAGISGHKSNQMLARLQKDVLDQKPTWMTLSCGVNDVWHGDRGVPLEDYKKNITEILDRCQAAGVKVMILTATQIKLPVTSAENTKLAAYNDFLRETAAARKLPLADLNAAMLADQTANNRVLTVDGVHMNLYGNLMMARGVLGAFGLDAAQMAKVEADWLKQPGTYTGRGSVKLSLAELQQLERYAAARKKTVDQVLNDLTRSAVAEAIKDAPAN